MNKDKQVTGSMFLLILCFEHFLTCSGCFGLFAKIKYGLELVFNAHFVNNLSIM